MPVLAGQGPSGSVRATVHGLAELENLASLGSDPEAAWRSTLSALLDGYSEAQGLAA